MHLPLLTSHHCTTQAPAARASGHSVCANWPVALFRPASVESLFIYLFIFRRAELFSCKQMNLLSVMRQKTALCCPLMTSFKSTLLATALDVSRSLGSFVRAEPELLLNYAVPSIEWIPFLRGILRADSFSALTCYGGGRVFARRQLMAHTRI